MNIVVVCINNVVEFSTLVINVMFVKIKGFLQYLNVRVIYIVLKVFSDTITSNNRTLIDKILG